jgi:hypothetical protein
MGTITSTDGTEIFYKDWGSGPTDRLQSRLAAFSRRPGHPNAVLPTPRLPRHRHDRRGHDAPRRPATATTWTTTPTTWLR